MPTSTYICSFTQQTVILNHVSFLFYIILTEIITYFLNQA